MPELVGRPATTVVLVTIQIRIEALGGVLISKFETKQGLVDKP